MTERWKNSTKDHVESSAKIEQFLDEIESVCRKHGISIGHEDHYGAFELCAFDEELIAWLRNAHDDLPE